MKRKRGHKNKKGKAKGPPVVVAGDNDDSGMDVDTPHQDGSIGKAVGRVKVKLMTPKTIESQSDTDKSSQQMLSDSANSSKKPAGSLTIKSSKSLGSTSSQYNKQDLDTALLIIKKVMKMDAAEPFNVPVNPEALGIPDYFDVIDTPMDFGTICTNLELGLKYKNSEDVYKDVQYIWDNCHKYNNKGDYILDLMRRVKKNFAKYWTAAGLYSGPSIGTSGVESSQENISPSDQKKVHMKGSQIKQKARKSHGRRHKSDCLCAICVLKRRRREREENAQIVKSPLGASDNNLSQEFRQEESSHAESPSGENSSSNMDGSLDPNADVQVEETEEAKMGASKQQFGSPSREKQEEEEDDDEEDEEESETEMKDEGNGEGLQQLDKSREEPDVPLQPTISEKLDAGMQTDAQRNASAQHEEGIEADNQEKIGTVQFSDEITRKAWGRTEGVAHHFSHPNSQTSQFDEDWRRDLKMQNQLKKVYCNCRFKCYVATISCC